MKVSKEMGGLWVQLTHWMESSSHWSEVLQLHQGKLHPEQNLPHTPLLG